ncbi:MAG: PAS domain-containing protein [Proteobacteria bacterium]|nr:PAS domain-containing protein [Pseudomonadota bacterium]
MDRKPTYEELVQKVNTLEKELIELKEIRMHADPTKDTAGNGIRSDTTGFKEVEQHADNLYRQLIDLYNNPIHVYDRESRLIFMNRKTAEIIGVKPESLIGKKLTEIIVSPMAEDLVKKNLDIIETGQPADYEIPIEFSGKKRWYWSHAQPIKDKDGTYSILMVISYDITERKNAEEKLRRRAYLLTQAQKLAHLGSYELDIKINDYERSDELFRIFGLNRDEVDSREDIIKRIHPDDWKYVEKQIKLLLAGNRVGLVEFRIIRPDGEERIVSSNSEILLDDSGIPIKMIGYFLDITESKRADEKLRRRENLLNQTQKLAHLGSYEYDMINNRFKRSDELFRIFGLNRHEVVSDERIIKTIHPDDRDYVEKQFKLSLTVNNPGPVEFRIIRPDGEERVVSAKSEIILDDKGVPVKFIGYVLDITEHKRAEQEIRRRENLLNQTQKLAHIGSYEFDRSRNRFERSDELFRILGIKQNEVNPEERLIKCVHPDDMNHLDKIFQLLESGHKIGVFEFRIIRPDGEERVVSANAEIAFDDSGVPIKRTGYLLDITERKRVEDELRQSEYLLNQAQQLAHLGSYEYDIKTNRFKRSDELFMILGIKRDKVAPEDRLYQWIHPDDRDDVEKQFKQALTGNSTDLFEFRIIRPDGEERVVSANSKTFMDDNGMPSKIIGSVLDITERKKAEEELRQSKNLLVQAQQLAHLGSFEYDIINDRYIRSDEIFRIFGISRDEVKPEDHLTQWIHPDDRDDIEKKDQAMEVGNIIGPKEFRIIRPDGEERVILSYWETITDDSGVPIKKIGCLLDITERKKVEKQREELILELQKALNNVKTLKGLLPICSKCKNIRTDKGYWSQIEVYLETHTDASFTHSMCPVCVKEMYGKEDWYKNLKNE